MAQRKDVAVNIRPVAGAYDSDRVIEFTTPAPEGLRAVCAEALPVVITRDRKPLVRVADGNAAFTWLLVHQGQSVDYAIRHGGYRVLGPGGEDLDEFRGYCRWPGK